MQTFLGILITETKLKQNLNKGLIGIFTYLTMTFFLMNLVPRSEYPLFIGRLCGIGGAEAGTGCSKERETGELGSEHCLSDSAGRILTVNPPSPEVPLPPPVTALANLREVPLSSLYNSNK